MSDEVRQIHGMPAGLAGIVGLRNNGELPRLLDMSIQPTIEALDLYIQGLMQHGFCTFTPVLGIVQPNAALAGATNPTVPPGELWWFENVSLRVNPAAGISYRAQIVLMERPLQATALGPPTLVEPALSHSFARADRGFWATADTNLAANYDQITGVPGADSSLMTFRYVRFRA